jgi:signal peptidase II
VRRPFAAYLSLATITLLLDQVSKYAVRSYLEPAQSIELWGDFFHLTYVRNVGAAFGLLPGQRVLFAGTSILVVVGIVIYWCVVRPKDVLTVLSLGLVTAGAIGNLIDRIVIGRVTDFLDFFGNQFPVFNVADMSVIIGVAILLFRIVFWPEEQPEEVAAGESEVSL